MGDEQRRIRLLDVLRVDVPKLHAAITTGGVDATPAARAVMRFMNEPRVRYQMRILYCPPLPLLWSFRPGDGTAASTIHQTYAKMLWQERDFRGRMGVFAHFLVWPLIVFGTMAWLTALNGRAVQRRSGKGRIRQLRDQLYLAARHGILPPWYYMFDLFDEELLERAGQYLRRDETKGGLFKIIRKRGTKRILKDKVRFADRCHEHDVRTPDYLYARKGAVCRPDGEEASSLPKADLFAKPSRGRGGRGAEEWRYDGTGWSSDGASPIDEAALLAHFRELSKSERYLVQLRLVPHSDLANLSGAVLTTIRMVTIRNEDGAFEATHAVFRMPNGPGAKVDNFHAGGLAAMVDMETGALGSGSDIGLRPNAAWHTHHPDSGAAIAGRVLPFWKETVDLARRAHAALPEWAVIGWDIAIVEDGPVVIEGNGGADLDIIQRAYRAPMGNTRFGELLAYHLEKLAPTSQA